MDLLRAGIASAVRDVARGRADPEQARLVGARPLAAWVDVWQGLTRLQDETERFALDKRQAIVAGWGCSAAGRAVRDTDDNPMFGPSAQPSCPGLTRASTSAPWVRRDGRVKPGHDVEIERIALSMPWNEL